MSTKIWIAWRCKKGNLIRATKWLHAEMEKKVILMYTKMINAIREDAYEKHGFARDLYISSKGKRFAQHCILQELLFDVRKKSNVGEACILECGFHIYTHNAYAYIIPYGFWYYQEIAEPLPFFIEDYHYQNQTDKPKEITRREWTRRSKTWDEVLFRVNRSDEKLTHFVFEIDSFYLYRLSLIYDQENPVEENQKVEVI